MDVQCTCIIYMYIYGVLYYTQVQLTAKGGALFGPPSRPSSSVHNITQGTEMNVYIIMYNVHVPDQ